MSTLDTANTPTAVEQTLAGLADLTERLQGVIEEETALVQAGRLRAAAALAAQKTTLAAELVTGGERLKANVQMLQQAAPARRAALKTAQERFAAVLQKNRVVLATAHAVAEGIVRRLSGDLARKASPQVYGASGRTVAPNPKQSRPLAISRTL
jgi:hypothetical protein